jgi:hypothetical protein
MGFRLPRLLPLNYNNVFDTITPIKNWARKNLKYECKLCQNNGTHNGNPLDNRQENIRWLCPNCHTQCKTYGGKGLHLHRKKKSEINPYWNTDPRPKQWKVLRPSKEILKEEIFKFPMEQLGIKYGVSGNAVKRWCKYYQITLPQFGRGYWMKNAYDELA